MSLPDTYSYHFYPVGQGLFSSGSIHRRGETKSQFLWVYDCGSSSSQDLIESGIGRLSQFARDRERIDLLVISHFDHDHISGIVRLLQEFRIGTLMLPYMPLAQRLVIAFEEGSGGEDDPLTGFYLNPVDFLLAQEGPGIERILFVPPSGNEGPPYPGNLPIPREPGPEDEPKIDFDSDSPKDGDDESLRTDQHGVKHATIQFLRPGSRITVASCLWEFIPYNDDPQDAIGPEFIAHVARERANLLSASNFDDRKAALKALKKTYDDCFGRGGVDRNAISLFLYSGPIYSSWNWCWLTEGKSFAWLQNRRWYDLPSLDERVWEFDEPAQVHRRPRCSILYSGDGYLDTPDRLQRLTNYLTQERVRRIGVFQVMHHGAQANWHEGVAAAISPLFSVFSSEPERRKWKHPHAVVLRDFWPHRPVQVDLQSNFNASGQLNRTQCDLTS